MSITRYFVGVKEGDDCRVGVAEGWTNVSRAGTKRIPEPKRAN